MKHKHNLRKITNKRSYSTEELALALGIHMQTVRLWRKQGLQPIESDTSPYLYYGTEVKRFLLFQASKHKVKLSEGEFYCLRCRKAVKPTSYKTINRGVVLGNGYESLFLEATCPDCFLTLKRFSSKPQTIVKVSQKESRIKVKDKPLEQLSLFNSKGGDEHY
jgi:hypothetical protein